MPEGFFRGWLHLLFDQWFLVLNQGYFFLYRVFAFSIIGCFLEANLLFSFSGRFYAFLFFVPAAMDLKYHDSIFSMFRSARIDGSLAGIVIFRSFQVLFVSGLPGEVPAYSLVHTLFFLFTPALSAVRFRFCYWGRDCAKEAPFCMACVPSSIACAITDRRILFLPADPGMCFF